MASLEFPISQVLFWFFIAYVLYNIAYAIYNIYFHPLAKVPGPKLRAAFYLPHYYELWTGDQVFNWRELHEKYGDIVRMSPRWVSVIKPEAWRDIYGHANKKPIPKDPDAYFIRNGVPANILSSNDADHTRIRRLLNHAFSDGALRNQEHIINSYVSLFIEKLQKKAEGDIPVDIVRYLNFTTFDILGDLCFAEPFDALKNEAYNEWIAINFRGFKAVRMFRVIRSTPILGMPLFFLLKLFPAIVKARQRAEMYTVQKTEKRMNTTTDRKDFVSYILKHNDGKGMTRDEIMKTMGVLIIAGSETSATLLSGAVFYLLKNRRWLQKLQQELRETFSDESEMTFASLSQLRVMQAVIMETFRMYPPVPTMLPRRTGDQGAMVADSFIPPNVTVGIAQYAAYRSRTNFKDPDKFAPQRFLDDEEYKNDNRSVVQPFSVGPRNCIGQTMAWSEIRTILARLVWNFDMELQEESSNWEKHKVSILWDKPALMVRLKARGDS
ncbi:cytochrome P450 monooxygenase-like protein [Lentithecium fluviatile CBS 122367]|uniref:Cytochrome P450 monooxygenase-like protein n=1 Tax=Lentithecium fluviatile CBS 122367 TaxID=1168545 RepID=A0A6G1J402_9PLEO|nr:cytochrome P450 monooxygenase-like protein [Lentithecium fluviatile CBS 122367]